jgi:hypothetical protein
MRSANRRRPLGHGFDAGSLAWTGKKGTKPRSLMWELALDTSYEFSVFVGEAGSCQYPGTYVAALEKHTGAMGALQM